MKKTLNAILLIVFALSLLNCSLQNKAHGNKNNAARDAQKSALKSAHLFICDTDSLWISKKGKIIKRNNDPILDCTKKKAFHGDLKMVDQLIEISNLLLIDRPYLYFSRKNTSTQPRGEKLFQYILALINDFECLDYGDYEICKGLHYLRECKKMIRTIDGKSWDDYFTKIMSEMTMKDLNAIDREGELMGDDFSAWTKRDYNVLKKAYQEGRVILKDFGEQ